MSVYANGYTVPILKWAGGKRQMLGEIIPRMPKNYKKYIEPFFGSGALFFAVAPLNAIISDSNSEIVNLYKVLPDHVEEIIEKLKTYKNTEEEFYRVRSENPKNMNIIDAAARTIFLNKTCFNGLYRVNKKGEFNTPYGHNNRTSFYDEVEIHKAANLLNRTTIICGDYHDVLIKYAANGDFIFLDPPYIPVSKYADFKRYTKEQFGVNDQRKLADDVKYLDSIGCKVMLTNSNHPLVYELYSEFRVEVFKTRRMINKNGNNRTGEDVIVTNY